MVGKSSLGMAVGRLIISHGLQVINPELIHNKFIIPKMELCLWVQTLTPVISALRSVVLVQDTASGRVFLEHTRRIVCPVLSQTIKQPS
jgi:hypothetical protein